MELWCCCSLNRMDKLLAINRHQHKLKAIFTFLLKNQHLNPLKFRV